MKLLGIISLALIGGVLVSSTAHASTAVVTAESLNCRERPVTSAPIVTKLAKGQRVEIEQREGSWAQVSVGENRCWVANLYLADAASFTELGDTYHPKARNTTSTPKISHHSSRSTVLHLHSTPGATKNAKGRSTKSKQRAYDGGSCPCSGSNVCIGPRGGRYCITSGGNKRYGV